MTSISLKRWRAISGVHGPPQFVISWPRHKLSAELGQFHEESSFYQALHDGTVRGTCMILDEKAGGKKNGPGIFGMIFALKMRMFCMSWPFFTSSPGALVISWARGKNPITLR